MKVTTVVPWDAASAVFTSDTELGIHRVDRWTLTDGGGKLRIERTVSNNEQELTARLVLVRQ